jgi:hypothetical protein
MVDGTTIIASSAMMASTTSSSISENPPNVRIARLRPHAVR